MRIEHRLVRPPARLVRRKPRNFPTALADFGAPAEHGHRARLAVQTALRQPVFGVGFPVEVGGHLGQTAVACLALAQPAPQGVDPSGDDGETRQECCEHQPAHPFDAHVVYGLRAQMHQQVDCQGVRSQRVERYQGELAAAEPKSAEQKDDGAAE